MATLLNIVKLDKKYQLSDNQPVCKQTLRLAKLCFIEVSVIMGCDSSLSSKHHDLVVKTECRSIL